MQFSYFRLELTVSIKPLTLSNPVEFFIIDIFHHNDHIWQSNFGLWILVIGITTCLLFTVIRVYGEPYRRKVNVSKFLYGQLRLIYVRVFCVEGLTKLRNIEGGYERFRVISDDGLWLTVSIEPLTLSDPVEFFTIDIFRHNDHIWRSNFGLWILVIGITTCLLMLYNLFSRLYNFVNQLYIRSKIIKNLVK